MATESPTASATDNAKTQVQEKAEMAQDKVKEGAQQAQSRARDQIDQRSTQAGEQVSATAQALRSTSEQLRGQGQDTQAKAAERVAHHAERLGGYLSESDADRLLRDAEDFGRRQPMAVIAVGVAVGFAASRFLKASSRNRYERPVDGGHERQSDAGSERRPDAGYPRATDGPTIPEPGVV
jgi:ElaB/YqjD/DUF883 family membrane-anchored ribosome-binding protein